MPSTTPGMSCLIKNSCYYYYFFEQLLFLWFDVSTFQDMQRQHVDRSPVRRLSFSETKEHTSVVGRLTSYFNPCPGALPSLFPPFSNVEGKETMVFQACGLGLENTTHHGSLHHLQPESLMTVIILKLLLPNVWLGKCVILLIASTACLGESVPRWQGWRISRARGYSHSLSVVHFYSRLHSQQ